VLNRGGFANADVLALYRGGQPAVVVKDYSRRTWPVRWFVAPLLVSHELRVLERASGLDGVPRPGGRVDRLALAMEWIDGRPLERRALGAALPPQFFDALGQILESLAARGISYLDLRSSANVLATTAGTPALVDLGSALLLPLPRVLVRWLERRAVDKLRGRFESPDGRERAIVPPPGYDLELGRFRLRMFDEGHVEDPTPLIIVADAGRTGADFAHLLLSAESRGRRAIAIDLPGFGASRPLQGRLAPIRLAGGVIAALDALRLDRFDLLGHGVGGLVAREVAARVHARVRALVTVDAPVNRIEGGFADRWRLATTDAEALARQLAAEVPVGLEPRWASETLADPAQIDCEALARAYVSVPVRELAEGQGFDLDAPGRVEVPWLAVVSDADGEERAGGARPNRAVWTGALAEPTRVWNAFERLAD